MKKVKKSAKEIEDEENAKKLPLMSKRDRQLYTKLDEEEKKKSNRIANLKKKASQLKKGELKKI